VRYAVVRIGLFKLLHCDSVVSTSKALSETTDTIKILMMSGKNGEDNINRNGPNLYFYNN
jgi:hypothetical protein